MRPRVVPLLPLALVGVLAGCGDDDGTVERKVVTTDAGTVISRTTDPEHGLRLEAQDDSLYVRPTAATPAALRRQLRGKPLGGRCTLRDGRTVGTIALYWRDRPADWGASLEVQRVYRDEDTPFAAAVRSCELRRGRPAGGATDVAAGPVLARASFVE
ncbi:hypothetical protein ACVU7I_04195 [Patulibacter sp. S7RM1-6]